MKKTTLVLALCLMAAATAACAAQTPAPEALSPPVTASDPGMFPFVVPWDDASPGTATDVSFLNDGPAGSHGFIVVKNGHFVESQTGKRIRFLGVGFSFREDFPTHANADIVAARLEKLGINVVRIHHHDDNGTDLWDKTVPGHHTLSADGLDRLDYLIAALKKHGIYVDLNLHVSRTFTPEDGFPASVNAIKDGKLDFDKRVDNFDRRMIELQKQFAKDYLTHVNPYTGLSPANDPCVVTVEINNENTLVGYPWVDPASQLAGLPEPFRGELVGFWNNWLARKYPSTAALTAAWSKSTTPSGPSIVDSTSQWSLETNGLPATIKTTPDASAATPAEVDITIPRVDDTDWHIQAHVSGLTLQEGATYTVSFAAKADSPRIMAVYMGLDQPDWHHLGLQVNANLTTDWKPFRYVFTVKNSVPDHDRISFVLGGSTGAVNIRNLHISPGIEGGVVPAGQTLEARTIDIPDAFTPPAKADWVHFLIDTERGYVDEMRGYLLKDLGVHANIIGTQMSYGGIESLNREAQSPYADDHGYWQHPEFPGKPWDSINWLIKNTPMAADLVAGGAGGNLFGMAAYRYAGKPYSISEYNHPAPSDFQAEMFPELATYAASQDWDMLYAFDYGDYSATASQTRIQGFFAINENPAKIAFLPSAAMIFRGGGFAPASGTTTLSASGATIFADDAAINVWKNANNGNTPDFFAHRLQVAPAWKATSDKIVTTPGAPSTSSIKAIATPAGAQYLANGAGAQAIAGYIGGETTTDGPLAITCPQFGDNFAALTLAALDGKPTTKSAHLLLTICGKAENVGMQYNAARTTVANRWGQGPALAEGIPAQVTLTTAAIHVWALDPTGHRGAEIKSQTANGKLTFTIGPGDQTVWYEIGN